MSEHQAPEPGRWTVGPQKPEPVVTIGKFSIAWRTLIHGGLMLGIGFLISVAFEKFFGREALAGLYQAQAAWIATVSHMNPLSLVSDYIGDTGRAFAGEIGDDGAYHNGASFFSPLVGLYALISDLFAQGAIFTLLQIGMGALAISVLNMSSSGGKRIFFGELHEDGRTMQNILFWPLAVVAAASGLAFVMQMLMLGALYFFSWLTGLAALAAGTTTFGGFCWYCVTKLGEKGVEHVVASKL